MRRTVVLKSPDGGHYTFNVDAIVALKSHSPQSTIYPFPCTSVITTSGQFIVEGEIAEVESNVFTSAEYVPVKEYCDSTAAPPSPDMREAKLDLSYAMQAIVDAAHGASSAAGWWIDPETGKHLRETPSFPYVVGTKLMLIVSEIAEAMEGHRKGLPDDKLPHRSMIEVELADAVHRIADLAGAIGCDLGGALVEKMAFNAVRPDHKPGARMVAGGKAY